MTPIMVILPIKLVSLKNKREHWAPRAKRTKYHRWLAYAAVRARIIATTASYRSALNVMPIAVTMTRLASRKLDTGDNLSLSCSAVRDGVADVLGINDNDPRIEWRYGQRKPVASDGLGGGKHGCEIRIEGRPA